jgi:hypothetical protein
VRRTAILAARTALVLALAAAIADLSLPAGAAPRVRLHLVDRSDSVSRGPKDAPRPADADRVRAYDQEQRPPGDTVLWASFGREIAFESTAVDGTETNLAGAIEAALARNPTEIVLYTDGRADPGRSLLLCRARGVPVHVFPIGPGLVRDVRIARLDVPTPSAAGETVTIDVTVVSTYDVKVPVRMGQDLQEISLTAGVPTIVPFPGRAPGEFTVTIEIDDACPENNTTSGLVLAPSTGKKKVLALTNGSLDLPRFDVERSPVFKDPRDKDIVVLDNVLLSRAEQGKLAEWVEGSHGGLILLGGPKSYMLGGWAGTPIDQVSPLRAKRDQKVAVVFVIDCSGSMNAPGRLDVIQQTVHAWWMGGFFESGDYVAVYPFPNDQGRFIESPKELNKLVASGGTFIAGALAEARKKLEQVAAPRSQIILLTDGETSEKETPKMRRDEGGLLEKRGIALAVVTVGKRIEIGVPIEIDDWKKLDETFRGLLPETIENHKEKPGMLVLHEHPVTVGAAGVALEWMNLTSAKADAQVVGTVGKAPTLYPALAFRQAGKGRVGAFAYERPDPGLLARSIEYVAGNAASGVRLSIDPPVVRARGIDPTPLGPFYSGSSGEKGDLAFKQVLSDTWEAPLPAIRKGTLLVQCGQARAAITIPCEREYEALGVDLKALERIASETGGRVLRSPAELSGLPRPAPSASRSGRPLFLVAALVLVFLEMALATFWKA